MFTPDQIAAPAPAPARSAVRDTGPADTFARFMQFVEIGQHTSECWRWRGSKPDGRYGHFTVDGRTIKAHRWLYEKVVGPIAPSLVLRHKCDNPQCVNPRHLEPGTHADNARDRSERGRGADRQGVKHPLAKLAEADVLEIRRLSACGLTQQALAERYGVRRGQIGKIIQRINWRHI